MASEKIKQDTVKALSAEIAAAGIDMKADPKHKSAAEKTAAFNASLVSAMDDERAPPRPGLEPGRRKTVARAMLKTVVTSGWVVRHQGPGVEGNGIPVPGHPRQGEIRDHQKFHEKYGRARPSPKSCGTGSRRCARRRACHEEDRGRFSDEDFDRSRSGASLVAGQGVAPDQQAEAVKLGNRYGLHPDTARASLDELRQRADMEDRRKASMPPQGFGHGWQRNRKRPAGRPPRHGSHGHAGTEAPGLSPKGWAGSSLVRE